MEPKDKDASLLFHEIPLYGNLYRKKAPHDIFVDEGDEPIEGSENASFPEAGGGVSLKVADLTRVLCWRTQNNNLELFEYSLDVDLHSNHFMIVFEDSKVLPGVHMELVNNQLVIVCCTVHGAHYIVLDIGSSARRQDVKLGHTHPSLLMNLPSFNFENTNFNYAYGHQLQGYANNFSAGLLQPTDHFLPAAVIALTTTTGNMVLIKMTHKSPPSHLLVNQSSRISRLFSGINPWAGSAGSDAINDLKVFNLNHKPCVAAICKDHKVRIWSCQTQELFTNLDLAEHIPDDGDPTEKQGYNYKIRTSSDTSVLSIYVGAAGQARFLQYIIGTDNNGNSVKLDFLSLVSSPLVSQDIPHRHLVDYCLSSEYQLVVLWHDVEDTDGVSVCKADVGIWHDITPHPGPAAEIPLQPYQDAREAYMDYIFTPGRFSPVAISRALSVHRRTGSVTALGLQDLKEKVSAHVQQEIQNNVHEEEEEVDEDLIQLNAWSTFYQTCIQYQQVVSHALGLTVDISSTSKLPLISAVKKGHVSVLTPVSSLEAVCRGSDPVLFQGILQSEDCTARRLQDLSKLIDCLGTLHGLLGAEFVDSMQQSIFLTGCSPADVVDDMMPEILDLTREFLGNSGPDNLLADIDDAPLAIRMLLICLEPTDFGIDFDAPDPQAWPPSSHGIEVLARCIMRHVENRFQLAILLYVFSAIIETLHRQGANLQQEDDVQLASRVTSYVRAYQSMFWLSSVQMQNISQTSLEKTMQTLSVHDMNETGVGGLSTMAHSNYNTLLEFFLASEGGKLLKTFLKTPRDEGLQVSPLPPEYLSQQYNDQTLSRGVVSAAVNFLVYLMWPLGPTLTLPDFLLSHGHHTLLQRYLQREIGGWCNWCPKSRAYMLAHCQLHHGNYNKAVRSFILASSGIGTEEYLITKLLEEDQDNLHPVAQEIIYYTKVLPIFEKLDLPEQVITLAQHAIQVARSQEQDPNLPILWSSIFRQSNNLSRHSEAFKAIILNPDPDHRKDCLRALAVSLCEGKKYKTLVEFPYDDLEDDLVSILEHRARGTDLAMSSHNYYDLIYAFHIHRGNFRRAASAMYEQGYRLGCEFAPPATGGLHCLQRQLDCYVACINCLHLVAEDNRWILHPIAPNPNGSKMDTLFPQAGYTSPKRQLDGDDVSTQNTRKVVIKELGHIQKEALLIETRVRLEEISKDPSQSVTGPLISAPEVVTFLYHAGLYDNAIFICSRFSLSLAPVFSSLASRCVRLSYADDKGMAEAWEWLQENETAKVHCSGGKSSTMKWTAADAAYRLLQVYLEKHGDEKSRGTLYYKAVAKSLLSLSATLPAWFTNAYKERNCPELLRLLVCFDCLEEATAFTVELINAVRIRIGTDFYSAAPGCGKASWLPYTVIEQLLCILEDLRTQKDYDELYQWLNDTLDEYLNVAETVSHDMVQAAFQSTPVTMTQ